MGRYDEAIAEAKRAQQIDPLSLLAGFYFGVILVFARQYERAIEEFQKTLEMDPTFLASRIWLPYPYALKGMNKEAIAEAQKTMKLSGGHPLLVMVNLAIMYSSAGKRDDAMKVLEELLELSKKSYASPLLIAAIYWELNQKDNAFKWIEKAYEERDHWMISLKSWPTWDTLRSDPRFIELLKKLNLE